MTLTDRLLLAALRNGIRADDSTAGVARAGTEIGGDATEAEIRAAIAAAVNAGLLHDPVRLEPGALQCHWRLELTPAGYAAIQPALAGPARE